MNEIKAHDFPEVYKTLGLSLDKLGCVMLDLDASPFKTDGTLTEIETGHILYYAKNKDRFWINGYVADQNPHMTLLYGLITPANESPMKELVNEVLKGWVLSEVEIENIEFFDSPYPDEEYYCVVGRIRMTPELLQGHQRLEFLPHVNTFTGYKPHITIAYIKKNPDHLKGFMIGSQFLVGKKIPVKGLNFGGNK